jgi:outer membrane protein
MRLLPALFAVIAAPALASAQGATPDAPPPTRPRLELSLDEAVKRALESNADITVEKLNPEAAGQSVREVQGAYDPFLSLTVSRGSTTTPATNVFSGGDKVDTRTTIYDLSASKLFATGATVRVDLSSRKAGTNNAFATFNPAYNAGFNANLTQPLLRNFRIDQTRQQLRVAKKNREISDVQFHQVVVNTAATVKQLYYDYLYTIDNLSAARKSLSLAKTFLNENQIKVRVGTLAPLDVVEAESEVASRDEQVILAEAAMADAEDALKRALFPANDPATWDTEIVPTDHPTAEPTSVDAVAAIGRALETRTDVVTARKQLENAQASLDYGRNQALPGVDLVANYGTSGVGGTRLIRSDNFGPVIETVPGGQSDAFSQVLGNDFPTWSVGVNVSYPIRNRSASAQAARLRVARDQSEASLRRLELQVASEVRSAARAVESNFKRVESTRAARVLQERRLDAETKRFGAGMSTNFLVTQAQRDLALAEVAELRAIADYRKSLVVFDKVQESGGGGVSIVSTATRATSTSIR